MWPTSSASGLALVLQKKACLCCWVTAEPSMAEVGLWGAEHAPALWQVAPLMRRVLLCSDCSTKQAEAGFFSEVCYKKCLDQELGHEVQAEKGGFRWSLHSHSLASHFTRCRTLVVSKSLESAPRGVPHTQIQTVVQELHQQSFSMGRVPPHLHWDRPEPHPAAHCC